MIAEIMGKKLKIDVGLAKGKRGAEKELHIDRARDIARDKIAAARQLAALLGVDEVYAVGGAQAIAALAYGTVHYWALGLFNLAIDPRARPIRGGGGAAKKNLVKGAIITCLESLGADRFAQ